MSPPTEGLDHSPSGVRGGDPGHLPGRLLALGSHPERAVTALHTAPRISEMGVTGSFRPGLSFLQDKCSLSLHLSI